MLPDLRNLGTILRVLLAVNGAALVVAFAREQRPDALFDEWIALTSYVEPYLLAALAVLAMRGRRAWFACRTSTASPRSSRSPSRSASRCISRSRACCRWRRLAAAAAHVRARRAVAGAALLLPSAHPGAVAGDRRSAAAGAAGADPPALPVQQHQRGAVADPERAAARRSRTRGHGRALSRADARQPRARRRSPTKSRCAVSTSISRSCGSASG